MRLDSRLVLALRSRRRDSLRGWTRGATVAGCMLLAACGGSGSSLFNDNTATEEGDFVVKSVFPSSGQVWQLNRPIEINFSKGVSFDSVTPASISIFEELTNAPALGQFVLVNNTTVEFQPSCPTSSQAPGLQPGGKTYVISIASGSEATATTVKTSDGKPLKSGKVVKFQTPIPANPNDPFDPILYYDPKVNQGPLVIQDTQFFPAEYLPKIVTISSDGTESSANFTNGSIPQNKFVGPNCYFLFTFDQPILPSPQNVSQTNLSLRFDTGGGVYSSIPTEVELISNCVNGVAQVRIRPLGLLPAGRKVRLVVSPGFSDIKGETNFFAANVPAAATEEPTVTLAATPDYDAIIEHFDTTATQDPNPGFIEPGAAWGTECSLEAAFSFGGQETDLELVVNTGTEIVIDTSSTVLTLLNSIGSPVQSTFQGGNIYLRKLTIKTGGRIRGQGPNPLRFFVNETVRIENNATLTVEGTNAKDVNTLLTAASFSEAGGAGNCGGGDGGLGNPITSQSCPQGGPGSGPFNSPAGGGGGGESALVANSGSTGQPCYEVEDLHPAGGGGGTYMTRGEPGYQGTDGTYNLGSCSVPTGVSAVNPTTFPKGGVSGPTPFINATVTDNFYGSMLQKQAVLSLSTTVGGGTQLKTTSQFPTFFSAADVGRFVAVYKATTTQSWEDGTANCTNSPEDPSLCQRSRVQVRRIATFNAPDTVTLAAPTLPTNATLGDLVVVLGTGGQVGGELLQLLGGQGGGGGGNAIYSTTFPNPNYANQDRKGAGGGGGGGVAEIRALGDVLIFGIVDASGGNGGAGENTIGFDRIGGGGGGGAGGSIVVESSTKVTLFSGATSAQFLARGGRRGSGSYGSQKDAGPPPANPNGLGHGGRGGKGLLQIHGPDPSQVVFGTNQPQNSNFDPNPLVHFSTFGAQSRSRSTWFDAGSGLAPGFPQYQSFAGTICPPAPTPCGLSGEVITANSGLIQPLAAVASGAVPAAQVTGPDVIVLPAADVLVPTNAKAAEPLTMLGDLIRVTTNSGQNFGEIIGVSVDTKGTLSTLDDEFIFTTDNAKEINCGGVLEPSPHQQPLNQDLGANVPWAIIPRYFFISTVTTAGTVNDFIPSPTQPGGARVQILFQGADADINGNVDTTTIAPDPLTDPFGTPDLTLLAGKRFIRFTVSFNIAATPGSSPSPSSPRPQVKFLKIPFRFN